MDLQTVSRKANSKSEVTKLRREGFIPAVLYNRGKEGETLAIKGTEFGAFLRHVKPGHLPTTIFNLKEEKGSRRVIVKDIQYNIINYSVTHLDFEELVENQLINVKVPIECIGAAECPGVKIGGVLRQVIRHVRVRCLPKDIPAFVELDVTDLGLKQSKRLKDLKLSETIRPLQDTNEVAAVIVKR
jgi:large subunit ribosomal protein L25